MAKGYFYYEGEETYNPEYGEILWKPRLNNWLEEHNMELRPVFYREGDDPGMQVTQENTTFFINLFVDEMDCIAVKYEYDEQGLDSPYFRDSFPETFQSVVDMVGVWALHELTLFPQKHIVEVYEQLNKSEDFIPDDWGNNGKF